MASHTVGPDDHLLLERLEVIGRVGLDFASHALPRPLLETIQLLVNDHVGVLMVNS